MHFDSGLLVVFADPEISFIFRTSTCIKIVSSEIRFLYFTVIKTDTCHDAAGTHIFTHLYSCEILNLFLSVTLYVFRTLAPAVAFCVRIKGR